MHGSRIGYVVRIAVIVAPIDSQGIRWIAAAYIANPLSRRVWSEDNEGFALVDNERCRCGGWLVRASFGSGSLCG